MSKEIEYYNFIKKTILTRLNDGFTAEEIRNQLITGNNIGLVGIEKKLNSIDNPKYSWLKSWSTMEVNETIKAINDIIPMAKVITGEAIYNDEKITYSYINNYNYSIIWKEEGYTKSKIVLNLNNQENFKINNTKVKSFITDYKYLYNVVS